MRQRVLSSHSHNSLSVATLDSNLVEQVYARCASVYDWLCGRILQAGRREAMYELRRQPGNQILEIGSAPDLRFRFIPTTAQLPLLMCPRLREAARNIDGRNNIQLFRMDAARLTFPEESLMERLNLGLKALFGVRAGGKVARWDQIGISDPEHHRLTCSLTCSVDELRDLRDRGK